MKMVHVKLECIGDNINAELRALEELTSRACGAEMARAMCAPKRQPWVARIVGTCERFGLRREFLRGDKDYSESNSIGSRGVYMHYDLCDGLYELNALESWGRSRRYFLLVIGDSSREVMKDEAVAWIRKAISESGA